MGSGQVRKTRRTDHPPTGSERLSAKRKLALRQARLHAGGRQVPADPVIPGLAALRALLMEARIGIGIERLDGETISPNAVLARILGYRPGELREKRFWEYTRPCDAERDRRLFKELVAGRRRSYTVEKEYIRKDGTSTWGQLTRTLILDKAGRPAYAVGISQDISERKLAERALQDSESRYRNFAECASDWFFETSAERIFTHLSEGFERATGFSRTDFIGRPINDTVDTDLSRRGFSQREEAVEQHRPFRKVELAIHDPAGAVRWIQSSGNPKFDQDGGFAGYQGAATDITERVKAERALRESQRLYSTVVESAPVGIYVHQDDRIVFVNTEAVRLLGGREARDFVGRSFWDIIPESERPAVARLVRSRYDSNTEQVEIRYVRLDGREITVRATGRAVMFAGRPAIQGVFEDVTDELATRLALQESEARFRAMLDNIPASVSLKELSGRYVLVNRAFAEWHGPSEPVSGPLTAYDYFPPDEAAEVEAMDREVIERRLPITYEHSVSLRGGSRIMALVTKFPVFDADGDLILIGAVGSDITPLKRTEAELRAAKESAEVASHAKTQFLANMSHELRTPLNSIIGFSQIMEQQLFGPLGDPRYVEYVADMLASGRSLLELINDILDISRVEIGSMTLVERWFDVVPLCQSSLRAIASRARGMGLELGSEMAPDLPPLYADERRIKQILVNLLSNAVKFTPAGGSVTLRARMDGLGRLHLEVTDTGVGIPPDKLEVAWSVFGQLENPMTRSREGAGLGLPLSKKLAELHGADLELESRVGRGTTVRLVFPAARTRWPAEAVLAAEHS